MPKIAGRAGSTQGADGSGGAPAWVDFMNEAVASGTPVSLADLRQRGYKGSSAGVAGVTSGQHVNQTMGAELTNIGAGGSNPFVSSSNKSGGIMTLDKVYANASPGGKHLILGVADPVSGTNTNLFTVLGKHTCQLAVLWVANRRLIPAKIRVGFDIAGGGTDIVPDAAWLYYNVEVPAESTLVLDAASGFWLGAADDVVVRTDVSGVSFGASGVLYETV